MNIYLLGFLLAAAVIGLWSPRRVKLIGLVAAMTAGLVLFLLLFPSKL
jgi:biotin transporter BioY